jgi:hypothetical protein
VSAFVGEEPVCAREERVYAGTLERVLLVLRVRYGDRMKLLRENEYLDFCVFAPVCCSTSLLLLVDCESADEAAAASSPPVSVVSRSVSAILRLAVEVRVTRLRVTRRDLTGEHSEGGARDA